MNSSYVAGFMKARDNKEQEGKFTLKQCVELCEVGIICSGFLHFKGQKLINLRIFRASSL